MHRYSGTDGQGINKPLANLSEAERSALEQYSLAAGAGMDPQRLQLAQSALQQQQQVGGCLVSQCW